MPVKTQEQTKGKAKLQEQSQIVQVIIGAEILKKKRGKKKKIIKKAAKPKVSSVKPKVSYAKPDELRKPYRTNRYMRSLKYQQTFEPRGYNNIAVQQTENQRNNMLMSDLIQRVNKYENLLKQKPNPTNQFIKNDIDKIVGEEETKDQIAEIDEDKKIKEFLTQIGETTKDQITERESQGTMNKMEGILSDELETQDIIGDQKRAEDIPNFNEGYELLSTEAKKIFKENHPNFFTIENTMRTNNSIVSGNGNINATMRFSAKEFIASELGYPKPPMTKKRKNRSGKLKKQNK